MTIQKGVCDWLNTPISELQAPAPAPAPAIASTELDADTLYFKQPVDAFPGTIFSGNQACSASTSVLGFLAVDKFVVRHHPFLVKQGAERHEKIALWFASPVMTSI